MKSIGIAILTLNAEKHLPRLLAHLPHRVLIVDSMSTDNTQKEALKRGLELLLIPRSEFNHGTTREKARRHLNTDIVVFLTQDAYLADKGSLDALLRPLLEEKAAMSYARQIPRPEAGMFEAFSREFNYPAEGHIRSLEDVKTFGVYTFFASNSCAAYRNEALDAIGGFSHVLIGEDTLACLKLLHQGYKVAYAAEAQVEHSHNYGLIQEFKRHFDTGLSRQNFAPLLPSDIHRGRQFAKTLLAKVLKTAPWFLPYAALHLFAKWLGYHIGRNSQKAPKWLKRILSSQPYLS